MSINKHIPLLDLEIQYQQIKDEIKKIVEEVLDSRIYILGPKVEEFEHNIATYCGTKYALGVSSGTDALLLSLKALNIGAGDEVIIPPFTFFATAGVVHRAGARIVFADIGPDTFNINPESIDKAITNKTKAIIPVHLFGQCADMDEIIKMTNNHNIKILEDAAQAVGSIYKGKRAGSIGDIAAFSAYPSKNLGAIGEAGFITTNDENLYEIIKMGRSHGQGKSTYHHKYVGGNFRMDAIQGAVLNYKLKLLDSWTNKRIENADYLSNGLKEKALDNNITIPKINVDRHIFHQYTIRVKDGKRDDLRNYLREKGIGSGVYYPQPLHLQECFAYLGYKKGDFPEAELACDEVLSLPVYSELTRDMIDYIIDTIHAFFKK
jgi:dTDP-4-amino-4,6-dideoxygalactose transaminase